MEPHHCHAGKVQSPNLVSSLTSLDIRIWFLDDVIWLGRQWYLIPTTHMAPLTPWRGALSLLGEMNVLALLWFP